MFKLKSLSIFLLSFCSIALSLNAQADSYNNPPKPLDNKVFDAMVGKWEGDSTMMGTKMHDELKVKWDLNHQFIVMELKAKSAAKPEVKFDGMGIFGIDANGNAKTWWFDNWGADSVSTGSGTFGDNILTLTDSNSMLHETRTFEVKGDEMTMHAKGSMTNQGKTTPFDTTTIYKRK